VRPGCALTAGDGPSRAHQAVDCVRPQALTVLPAHHADRTPGRQGIEHPALGPGCRPRARSRPGALTRTGRCLGDPHCDRAHPDRSGDTAGADAGRTHAARTHALPQRSPSPLRSSRGPAAGIGVRGGTVRPRAARRSRPGAMLRQDAESRRRCCPAKRPIAHPPRCRSPGRTASAPGYPHHPNPTHRSRRSDGPGARPMRRSGAAPRVSASAARPGRCPAGSPSEPHSGRPLPPRPSRRRVPRRHSHWPRARRTWRSKVGWIGRLITCCPPASRLGAGPGQRPAIHPPTHLLGRNHPSICHIKTGFMNLYCIGKEPNRSPSSTPASPRG